MTKTFITNAEDFEDALADLVAEFKGRGKQVIDPYDMKVLLGQMADYIRYDEKYQSIDHVEVGEDAMQTANWCIENARYVLGLSDESAEEAERAALRTDEEQESAA